MFVVAAAVVAFADVVTNSVWLVTLQVLVTFVVRVVLETFEVLVTFVVIIVGMGLDIVD